MGVLTVRFPGKEGGYGGCCCGCAVVSAVNVTWVVGV